MRQKMKKLILLLAVIICAASTQAKDLRIGVINSEQILSQYTEYRNSMKILQEEKQDWDRQIGSREAEIQAEVENFRLQENAMSPVTRSEMRSEIDRKMAELDEFRAEIYSEQNGRFYLRNQELMEPLVEKVNQAIKTTAEEDGYDLILDNAMPIVVYVSPETVDVNLNERVLEFLQNEE
jgi:outer membrane protein